MYVPDAFQQDDRERLQALVRNHPLGLLVTQGPGGITANPVPFVLYDGADGGTTLRAHVARANPQWRDLHGGGEAVVIFQGAEGYVTPSWYATKQQTGKVVPTWNYAVVEARGPARSVEDEGWLRRQIDDLTLAQEGGRPSPWRVADAPSTFVAGLLRAIVGIEVEVSTLLGKWKVSQNQPEANRGGVADGFAGEGHDEMARLVAEA